MGDSTRYGTKQFLPTISFLNVQTMVAGQQLERVPGNVPAYFGMQLLHVGAQKGAQATAQAGLLPQELAGKCQGKRLPDIWTQGLQLWRR